MINLLFVCMGNICRSPMAEAVFQDMVDKAGLSDRIRADSAGTSGWHEGEQAHTGTLNVLRRNGIAYNGRSRPLLKRDLDKFDYIVMMDNDNLENAHRICGGTHAKLTLFLSYANRAGYTNVIEVPDPYYTGGFDEVYKLVQHGCKALLEHIRQEQKI